jgi:hypothetical protein
LCGGALLLSLSIATPAMAVPLDGGPPPVPKHEENVDPVTKTKVKETSVIQYVNSIYVYLAGIGGLIAVMMLVYAGYAYMTSYGDPEKISNAKDIIEKTLISLALLILAAVILKEINPQTVEPCTTPNQNGCGSIDFSKPAG